MSTARSVSVEASVRSQRRWGSREWFGHLLKSQGQADPSAYFALNGYHLHRHQQILTFLQQSGMPRKRDAMLDVGCGTGHMTDLIRSRLGFRDAVGIDFVPELVSDIARRYPKSKFMLGNLPHLEFDDKTFDLVIAAEVLYYLDDDGQRLALDEICRVLKREGILLFTSSLGDRYYTTRAAVDYISKRLTVVDTTHSHNRIYHMTLGPLNLLKRLDHVINTGSEPGTSKSQERLKAWRWLVDRVLFRKALRCSCALSGPILRLRWLPSLMERISGVALPNFTKTNVNIIAQKESE